jgi:hypothetical protein
MALWKQQDGTLVGDGSWVTGPDGTTYPPAWDKSTLTFLTPIQEVAQPSGPDIVVIGWHLDGTTQVWDTRPKSQEELDNEAAQTKNAHNAPIYSQLAAIDTKRIRPTAAVLEALAAQVAPDQVDLDRLTTLNAEADALRAQLLP